MIHAIFLLIEWSSFGLTCLVTVMPKGQSPTVKVSVCNILTSKTDGKYNLIPRPVDSN